MMTFGGYAYGAMSDAELDQVAEDERGALTQSATALGGDTGALTLSAGTTPTAHRLRPDGAITELHPGLRVERLYEQHAIVHSDGPSAMTIGARVDVVPNHACAAANLHGRALIVEDGELVDIWSIGAAGPGG